MLSNGMNMNKLLVSAVVAASAVVSSFLLYKHFLASNDIKRESNSDDDDDDEVEEKDIPRESIIDEIWIYPIAGCQGICLGKKGESWNLIDGGLQFDREFSFVVPIASDQAESEVVSANIDIKSRKMKKVSNLPIQHEIFTHIVFSDDSQEGAVLVVEYPNAPHPLRIPLSSNSKNSLDQENSFEVERYGMTGRAIDMGDDIANWFQDFVFADMNHPNALSQDQESYKNNQLAQVRLARVSQLRKPTDNQPHRGCGALESDAVRFQYFSTLHIVTQESVEWLKQRLHQKKDGGDILESSLPKVSSVAVSKKQEENVSPPEKLILTAARFRPSLVVSGVPHPIENRWKKCEIVVLAGSSENKNENIPLRFIKHTDRCEIPTMHPITGRRQPNLEPVSSIKKLRGARYPHQIDQYEKAKNNSNNNGGGVVITSSAEPPVKAMLGFEMNHEKNGKISVGDKIVVVEFAQKGLKFIKVK